MAITNYIIIDHVGQIASSEIESAYNKVYTKIAEYNKEQKTTVDNYEVPKTFTMKKVCEMYSPFAREITPKMRAFHRYNRTPKKVYILCDEYTAQTKAVEKIWSDRNIMTEIVAMHQKTLIVRSDEASKARRCASIWANALGWSFSAPLFRDEENIRSAENYALGNIMHRREIIESDISAKVTLITTDELKYQSAYSEVASEDECEAFFEHYKWLYRNHMLAESLEPDYTLCPNCGRPIRLGASEIATCSSCDTEVESYMSDSYYESYSNDSDDDYLDF